MIFDALSNAAYRVSLRGPGAEIEGGSQPPPPAGGGKSRGPAGRGLTFVVFYQIWPKLRFCVKRLYPTFSEDEINGRES